MSNNHVKEPGSPFNQIPLNKSSSDVARSSENNSDQSGWKNYPKELTGQEKQMSSQTEDERENILEQLIAESTSSITSEHEKKTPTSRDPAENYDSSTIPNLMAEDSPPHVFPSMPDSFQRRSINTGTFETPHSQDSPVLAHHAYAVIDRPSPSISQSENESLQVEALERWLEKPVPEKNNNSYLSMIGYGAACVMVAFLTYTGIYISGSYNSFDGPIKQVSTLIVSGDNSSSTHTKSYSSPPGGDKTTSSFSGQGNSSGGAGSGNGSGPGKKISAAIIAAPALKTQTINCPEPAIKLSAIPGGRTSITMTSSCRSSETVKIRYADVKFASSFNENGIFNFLLDGFAGAAQPIYFEFEDGKQVLKNPVLQDMGTLSKVAVVWDSPLNLNLHAFEYAAKENSMGHIWEKNPLTVKTVNKKIAANGSGHGFISSKSGSSSRKKSKVEVYTFLHSPKQASGVIKLALDYEVKTSGLQAVSCASSSPAYVNYKVIRLIRNQAMQEHEGQLLIDLCTPLTKKAFISKAVEDLELGSQVR